ncbi:hypothetical protein P5772_25405 [Bacillus cereus]|uniref:hypothetical protein n=1 Tax=Bacillus cereus TaxID=1396 RepID=UPI0015CF06DD|nr:hypothetical protein [Bacillus cereus]MDF9495790.1 hypothetical protein [Bacillus cereus]
MSGITNFECPQCGNKLWKYDHGETIKLECDLLECYYELEIDLEEVISIYTRD